MPCGHDRAGGSINVGLENDKKRMEKFMKSKYNSTFTDLVDQKIPASLNAPGLKTVEQIRDLFNPA